MIADVADIHANNKIGVPSYSKQSYVNTSSELRNASGNGFRFPAKRNQRASNYVCNRRSNSEGNSPLRNSNENQDQKRMGFGTPRITRKTEMITPRGSSSVNAWARDSARLCHFCDSDQHLIRHCDEAKKNQNTQKNHTMYIFQKSRVNQIQVIPTRKQRSK